MMDFWPENQGHVPQYTKYGTLPGRNCTQNYQDRYQGMHYPLYYSEQQDQGRDSSYWTVPGSRTGGSLQEYTNWNDPELAPPTASQFPFILDRHSQQHQELREYQHQEARDREWTAIQRAARDYERGMMREGWQRRWEPVNPVRYNREVSKRNDSSYRELEAWAARYSHSLPRRRRIEAELRGASQGLLDKSRVMERDNRSGVDPRVAAVPQLRPPTNIRESGLWDRGSRQQGPNYNPPSAPAPETSHSLDIKEKTSYQRRMFSQPPGYIAPPPYNTPHKNLPAIHQYDTNWEQELKRQVYQSQPKKQDFSKDLHEMRKAEIERFTKPELYIYKQQKEPGVSSSAVQPEYVLSLQQAMPETPNAKINETTYSKVIEGRKFRLNKKTGGMTIFCLVSRIAGTETDTPCLPLCAPQTNIHSAEVEEVSKSQDSTNVSQTLKLADEVDFKSQAQTSVQPSPQDKQETPICVQSESLSDNVLNRADAGDVSQQIINETDSTFGRQAQSLLSVPVKYPLWREPSFTSKAETDTSCLNTDSDGLLKQEDPSDADEGKQDTETESATESKDGNPKLLIDTTCVVVKMELIPSPKKEHVHYLSSDKHNPFNTQANVSPESVHLTPNAQNSETATESNPLKISEYKESEMDPDVGEKKATEDESGMSFLSIPSSLVSDRETLAERAQRILGIALDDDIVEEQPGDKTTGEKSHEEAASPSTENININKATEQIIQDTAEDKQLLEQTDDGLCSKECNDAKDQVMSKCEGGFVEAQDQVTGVAAQSTTEFHPDADIQTSHESKMTEDPACESSDEEISEDKTNENLPEENECLNPLLSFSPSMDSKEADSALSLTLTSSDFPAPSHASDSNTQECPDPELPALASVTNLDSPPSETPDLPTTPALLESAEHFPSSDSPADEPLKPLLSLTVPTVEGQTQDNMCFEGQAQDRQIRQLVNNGLINMEPLIEDMTQQLEPLQPNESACVKENNVTDEDNEVPISLLEPITENSTEVSDLKHQPENGLTEGASCVKETLMTEVKSKEGDQITGLAKEDPTDCQTQRETEMLEQQFAKEPHLTDDGLHEEGYEDPSDIIEQQDFKENDWQTEIDTETSQHTSEFVHSDEDVFANDTHTTEESFQEDADEDLSGTEQTEHYQTEIGTDTLPKQNEFVQSEEAALVNDTHTCEDRLHEEADEDSLDVLEHRDLKENDCQTETEARSPNPSSPSPTNIDHEVHQSPLDVLQPSQVNSPPQVAHSSDPEFALETASVGSSALNPVPETVPPQAEEDSLDVLEHTDLKENDCQTETEAGSPIPSSPSPTNTDHEVHQSPLDVLQPSQVNSPPQVTHSSDPEFALEAASVGSSALNPVPETVPPQPHLDSHEQASPFSSSSPPAHDVCESISSISPSAEQKEKPEYPKSLWDAVNRIRKHTAPDSENEEEEVADMWDPDSVEDVMVDVNSVDVLSYCNGAIQEGEKSVCDEAEQQVVLSVEDVQKEQSERDTVRDEPCGHVEEDTLSCSSNSSHESEDTIIVTEDDDEDVEAVTECKTDIDREFDKTDEEQSCSGEVRGEAAAEEEDDDKDGGKRSQTESEPVDVTETEQKGNEEGFVCTKAADEVVG